MPRPTRLPAVRVHTDDPAQERAGREQRTTVVKLNDVLRRLEVLEGTLSPFGRIGRKLKAMNNADQVLSVADGELAYIRATGTLTANRNLDWPASMRPAGDEEAFFRMVHNNTGGGFSIIVHIFGIATGVTIAAGVTRILGFSNAGVFLVI